MFGYDLNAIPRSKFTQAAQEALPIRHRSPGAVFSSLPRVTETAAAPIGFLEGFHQCDTRLPGAGNDHLGHTGAAFESVW